MNIQNTDLREVKELTQEKLEQANGDWTTVLPEHLQPPAWWSNLPAVDGPLYPQAEYSIKVCKASLYFSAGENWHTELKLPNSFFVTPAGITHIGSMISVTSARWICDPDKPSEEDAISKAPDDMIAWFSEHPYLRIESQEEVDVGGMAGTQFDAIVFPVPEQYLSFSHRPCVPLFPIGTRAQPFTVLDGNRNRFIVLNVEGEVVTIVIESPADEFDNFLERADEVLANMRWGVGQQSPPDPVNS